MESGQTPIVIWWDYLLASEISSAVKTFKIVIPSDGHYAAYYDQAISKTAPDPAAARLWEEYLYSVTGQNLWLQGKARPDRAVHPGQQRHRGQDRARGPAAGAVRRAHFPTQAQETDGRGHGRAAVGQRGRLARWPQLTRPRLRSRSLRAPGRTAAAARPAVRALAGHRRRSAPTSRWA